MDMLQADVADDSGPRSQRAGIVGDDDPRIIPAQQIHLRSAAPYAERSAAEQAGSGATTGDPLVRAFEVIIARIAALLRAGAPLRFDAGSVSRASKTPATLGMDGIALATGEFVAYPRVVALERLEDRLSLDLGSGRRLDLRVAYEDRWRAQSRIERGRHAARSAAHGDVAPLVWRAGETVDEWRARLHSAAACGGYRSAALDRSCALSAACDPTAEPPLRVAAIVFLETELTADERSRLVALRDETAHPSVRYALDLVAPEPTND